MFKFNRDKFLPSILAVSVMFFSTSVWAGAKSNVTSQSAGSITANASSNGSNNKTTAKASVVSVRTKQGQMVSIKTTHNGNISAIATSNGSHNDVSAKAVVVDISSE